MKKRVLFSLAPLALGLALLASCSGTPGAQTSSETSEIEKLIQQAQNMSNEELFQKAIEESNGKTMYGVGNSSRGSTAATGFIDGLKKIDPNYSGTIEWSQPKNNSIFTILNADINSATHTYSMTLIQDGAQIQAKMINNGNLVNFIPKDWSDAEGVDTAANGTPLTLQSLAKVFMYNDLGGKEYTNVWQFVGKDEKPLFMGVNSEPVGKNFLYMLTNDEYSTMMKTAFDALSASEQAYFQPTIDAMEKEAASLGLTAANAKYGLAWVKLWATQYNERTDDGPICNELVTTSAVDESGLLVYSKLRSVEESASSSVSNIAIAAYDPSYVGPGGYAYKHYLQVVKTAPLPWTAMAFISYMTTTTDGFAAWGKDIGGWSANPGINQDHSNDGGTEFPAKNDKGQDFWLGTGNGSLVQEDPVYAAKVAPVLGDWIDMIVGSK